MRSKHLYIALGVAAAALGALWYSFRRRQTATAHTSDSTPGPMDNLKQWFVNQFEQLDIEQGAITKDSLLLVFGKIRSQLSERLHDLSIEFIQERVKFYRVDSHQYKRTVQKYLESQRQITDEICRDVLQGYQITQYEFGEAIKRHKSEPSVSNEIALMNISANRFGNDEVPRNLKREQFAKIINKYADLMEIKVRSVKIHSPFDIVLAQAEVADDIYQVFGFTENQVMAALEKYKELDTLDIPQNIRRLNDAIKILLQPLGH